MLKTILFTALAALAVLLIFAATRPDTFRVERSERIQATPEKIFPMINDLHRFNTWNPYEKKDPSVKGQYAGSASGPGASYSWDSDKVGAGSMTIQDSSPARITMQLHFLKPFEAKNTAEFTLQSAGDATQVTWAMQGPANFMSKLMQTFSLMDKMVGKDFADGLVNLKIMAEGR